MRNKKASIPVTILVIGVFVVCATALASFYLAAIKTLVNFSAVVFVEEMNSQIERYKLYTELGFTYEEIKELLNIQTDAGGDYLYIEAKEVKAAINKDKIISVKYYLQK